VPSRRVETSIFVIWPALFVVPGWAVVAVARPRIGSTGRLGLAIVLSVVGAIVGEYVGANRGLGALIIATQGSFDTPIMFSVFVVLTVVGTVLYKIMEVLEKVLFGWRYLRREG